MQFRSRFYVRESAHQLSSLHRTLEDAHSWLRSVASAAAAEAVPPHAAPSAPPLSEAAPTHGFYDARGAHAVHGAHGAHGVHGAHGMHARAAAYAAAPQPMALDMSPAPSHPPHMAAHVMYAAAPGAREMDLRGCVCEPAPARRHVPRLTLSKPACVRAVGRRRTPPLP